MSVLLGDHRFFERDRVRLAPWLRFTTAGEPGEVIKVTHYQFADEVMVRLDSGLTLTVPPCELEWWGGLEAG